MVAALSSRLSELTAWRGEHSEAIGLGERARDEFVRFRGPWFRPEYALRLARLVWHQGDVTRATSLLREALESAAAQGNGGEAELARLELAVVTAECGQADAASALLAEAGAASVRSGGDSDAVLAARGRVALLTGDCAVAASNFREILARARAAESRPNIAQASEHLAWALAESGELEEATSLLAEAQSEREAMGMVLYPVDVPHHQRAMALVGE